ncbi:hypothetical protein DFQ26_004436 [Actinomortierella ambigua]|nr:hypothetical protein DFQ26_004436 [Actinomortierella ambigua]
MLDNFGPWTRPVEEQPMHLLEHMAQKRALATKRLPFHPSIESAIRARTHNGNWQIREDAAAIFTPRSLMPMERTDDEGQVIQGYTWRSDRVLTIRSATSVSDDYAKAFMARITCPLLAVLASKGFMLLRGVVEERVTWPTNAAVTTVCEVEGFHHVHLEDAPLVAQKVSEWVLAQDRSEKARL